MRETIAVLGTGKMGTALARAFAAAGHSVVAWNRTPARAEPLRTVATLASTPATAARDASLIVASLTDYAACGQVLFTAENASCTTASTGSCTATNANATSFIASLTPIGVDTANSMGVTTTWTATSSSGAVCNSNDVSNSPGCVVQVQVSYSFNFMLPLLPANALVLKNTAALVIAQ